MTDSTESLAVAWFSEVLMVDQLARNRIAKALPKGMALSHFSVLNHLAHVAGERSPAQLADAFHLSRGAMTNTLHRLEWAGWIHIRPDWDDARRKMVALSPAGLSARNAAIESILPIIARVMNEVGDSRVRATLPVLREIRLRLSEVE